MKYKLLVFFLFFVFINISMAQLLERTLNKEDWQFRKKGDKKWHPALVPGTIHTDLFKNKIVSDPFFSNNEDKLQWIEKEDWEYATSFRISQKELMHEHIELNFDGLDTYAKIYLNDSLILTADNMFRSWKIDVKKHLRKGKNNLKIIFESAIKKAKNESDKLSYSLPGGEKVFSRKAHYQYGWDWGPRFVTCGIWKDVKIVFWKDARIINTQCIQRSLNDSLAELEFVCEIESDMNNSAYMDITFAFTKDLFGQRTNKVKLDSGLNIFSISYDIKNPQRWWSNGSGFPFLYNFEINLSYDSRILDQDQINIGLRTIELIQEPDSSGSSFYFKLNGIPVFMKGANYIPSDNFIPQVKTSDYSNIIKNVVDANMNMLRVWGGGVYPDDQFYNECDKNGILIWQDFMFACSMYPGDDHFIKNVSQEIDEQVKRLRNHPCLALWCGNNEINEGWENWGWQKEFKYSFEDSTLIKNNYNFLFENQIREIVNSRDPVRYYWPSSPSIGWGHKESLLSGDSHYWGVWWGMEPFESYNKNVGRFMSEYGFQGMPDITTFSKIGLSISSQMPFDSLIFKAHQKHPAGYETIRKYMERDYKLPKEFENYVYVSQLVQADGMKTAIEAHRRAKPYCMGTLYWQLNDCWPVVSWSSIDYYNNWKAAHYEAKHAYEKMLISVNEVNERLQIYIVNDGFQALDGKLFLRLVDFNGNLIWSKFKDVRIMANTSSIYDVIEKKDFGNFNAAQTVLYVSIVKPNTSEEINALFYFVKPKDLQLLSPLISIEKRSYGKDQCFVLSSDVLLKDVFITIDGKPVQLSDNYFDLLPFQEKIIYLPKGLRIKKLEKKIKIKSLKDIY